ncbi:MAG: hypothetical protein QOD06_1956 [Candidatus Binatota bacterium]|jgi:enamine deaminase RidA (YjgF/YER057c/UK114 family)|nr:hypothetical protein [Candidatus Binatota bacterium]
MTIRKRIDDLGLTLPPPIVAPAGLRLPFEWVRVRGNRAYVSGHVPVGADGAVAKPLGKVGSDVTVEQGYQAARLTALAVIASLDRALGDLERVTAWLRIFGMVNSAAGFRQQPLVINGVSDLILELWGPERGAHARSAVGMAELPFGVPVEVEAEVEIAV